MNEPIISRPDFPEGYLENPKSLLPWSHVVQRLTDAKNYWLCSVRPNGQPHAIPKWGVWVDGKVYFDGSPKTRHALNIAQNPHVCLHLESGDDVIIIEGTSKELQKPSPELAVKIAQVYRAKYTAAGYAPEPSQWDEGGLFEITLHKAIAWTNFTEDPTRFIFN